MSVCAVVLAKDEEDIIEYTVRHLAGQTDYIIVSDNMSTDGTREILNALVGEGLPLQIVDDHEVGFFQDKKTTELAMHALARGFQWVLPCDVDEFWYATDRRPIRDWLDGLSPDVQLVTTPMFNHLSTALDPADVSNPFERIGWRKREHGQLPKVCVRARPDLRIHMGNHSASFDGIAVRVDGGLAIRHYSWRSPEQYLRKIRNGQAAYKATNMPENIGVHWRMFENATDEAVLDHFKRWFFSEDPYSDTSLIFDPAPTNQEKGEGNENILDEV